MSTPASPAGYGTPPKRRCSAAGHPPATQRQRPWSGWWPLRGGCGSCPTRCCRCCARPTARCISTRTTASTGCSPSAGRGRARRRCCCACTCRTSATPTRAPIVVDPKSELARLCLELTPPDCGKRVWYLDLGRPMFGMSPLRRDPARTSARAGLGDRGQHRAGDLRHRRRTGVPEHAGVTCITRSSARSRSPTSRAAWRCSRTCSRCSYRRVTICGRPP